MTAAATRTLRVGTRASALARAQTSQVVHALGVPVQVVPIVTDGDRTPEPLAQIGGTGVFVSALRHALVAGEIDVAVHSYKDLPTAPADGFALAAVPVRDDPRDALVARDGRALGELPPGARVGTGSPRRAAQLRALGLGLEIVEVRGNVDTRLGKVADGTLDAVVLAYAGLRRLGRADEVSEVLDPIQLLPAPAQGALAVECRTEDGAAITIVSVLDDPPTRAAVAAERALLTALEAGCSAPIGALAEVAAGDSGDEIYLRGSVTALDGSDSVRRSVTGPLTDAEGVGRRLAAGLLADGADTMMAATLGSGQDVGSST
jgi:hydroxymethylbilane synthase